MACLTLLFSTLFKSLSNIHFSSNNKHNENHCPTVIAGTMQAAENEFVFEEA
jgi:hypothetical protein